MSAEKHFTSDDQRWTAVQTRDQAADSQFWCCVRTTGIYCRPSCPARPNRENLIFVDKLSEARSAGYRACKRCRPDEVKI